jgi:hypothetical protein
VEAAVEKINSLLESFMGINDADLGIIIFHYFQAYQREFNDKPTICK